VQAPAVSSAEWRIMHNHPEGTTLDTFSVGALAPPASATGVSVQRRL